LSWPASALLAAAGLLVVAGVAVEDVAGLT